VVRVGLAPEDGAISGVVPVERAALEGMQVGAVLPVETVEIVAMAVQEDLEEVGEFPAMEEKEGLTGNF
jgi:hypothetical protein